MLTFNNKIVLSNDKWIEKPELVLPPATIRLRYASGTTPTFSKGTAVCVDETNNVWDLTSDSFVNICYAHTNLVEVIGGNLSGISSLYTAFSYCTSLKRVGKFTNTESLNYLRDAFERCQELEYIEPFDTPNVLNCYDTFEACYKLKNCPLSDLRKVQSLQGTFQFCYVLEEINIQTSSELTTISSMCDNCWALKQAPQLVTYNVTGAFSAFRGCIGFKTLPYFNMPKAVSVMHFAESCYNVESGALAMYNQFAALGDQIEYYEDAFKNCGRDTVTGAAELAQIPSSWGGTGA